MQEQSSPGESFSRPNACQQRQDWYVILVWRNDIPQAERCRSNPCCSKYGQQSQGKMLRAEYSGSLIERSYPRFGESLLRRIVTISDTLMENPNMMISFCCQSVASHQ